MLFRSQIKWIQLRKRMAGLECDAHRWVLRERIRAARDTASGRGAWSRGLGAFWKPLAAPVAGFFLARALGRARFGSDGESDRRWDWVGLAGDVAHWMRQFGGKSAGRAPDEPSGR